MAEWMVVMKVVKMADEMVVLKDVWMVVMKVARKVA